MARRYHSKTAVAVNLPDDASAPHLTQAMVKGTCPLCAVLKDFQTAAVETINPSSSGPLCNFHCWSVANSAPAMVALSIYSNILHRRDFEFAVTCSICAAIQVEEERRVGEFIADCEKVRFAEWMNKFGTLCLIHAVRLNRSAPEPQRDAIKTILDRSIAEIEVQLREYAEAVEAGDHSGGGVLGKTAAFLVGFRGFSF